jgi:methyltransferase
MGRIRWIGEAMTIMAVAVVFVPMAIEAARASRNEHAQRSRGGIEPADDVYPLMRLVYPVAFLSMIAEQTWRGAPGLPMLAAGAALLASAKALKWWTIRTLGPAWTFRVIVVPGMKIVTYGPYRFLRHPNYVAVVGELVGVALMTGAFITGPLVTIVFAVLLLKRIAVEERVLRSPQTEATCGFRF